ncbi:ATP-dependent nuclease [Celeribacter ethanolicus]|uniref:ATP-dependent nuclease n=1 Tax=Celeribacter ethanolicus TaxID=1758178 RepID=UPI000ADA9FC0|nr:AAA family ATPase [Celeribacter ethanolicus]
MVDKPTVSISEITFSGGQTYQMKANEKIILVGPNNSGKSQTLREIIEIVGSSTKKQHFVVKDLKLEKVGSSRDLQEFLDEEASLVGETYRFQDWNFHANFVRLWDQKMLTNGLAPGFFKKIDANDRLKISEQQKSIGDKDPKSKPQHVLYDSEELMKRISELFRKAFGKELMINFRGGSMIPIHVGNKPPANLTNQVSDAYVQAVKANPLLDEQGDGMKSYAGILFEAVVANLDVTLLDEPEAFLHPPQMRRLGETLAAEVAGQLIVATHSSDIMRGFLEGTKGNVRILRIRRDGEKNFVSEASSDAIQELWARPVLRYSNALDGIFHEQTILCEDDSDCRLINAMADHLAAGKEAQWLDTAYVPSGGKHGIPKIANVLRKIGVPIKAVFDMDLLSEGNLMEEAVRAFGGDWDELSAIWERLDSAVRQGQKPKTNAAIKADIDALFEGVGDDGALPRGDIQEALKQNKPWNAVKRYGCDGFPNGDAQKNYLKLKKSLEEIGIYLVPVGETENFCRELGSHGPKFVNRLLSDIPLDDPRLSKLRDFVKEVHQGAHSPI